MAYYLKKLAASVVLEYADSMISRALAGENFHLDFRHDSVVFRLDLGGNLEVRNRGLACHRDAKIFQGRHHQLRLIHICDKNLSAILGAVAGHVEEPWRLELHAGRPFIYAARPVPTSLGAGFSIRPPLPARTARQPRVSEMAHL
ncbi:MAG: hypothetical protein ACAH83_06525 [Alphaproteobacteria bacterium]